MDGVNSHSLGDIGDSNSFGITIPDQVPSLFQPVRRSIFIPTVTGGVEYDHTRTARAIIRAGALVPTAGERNASIRIAVFVRGKNRISRAHLVGDDHLGKGNVGLLLAKIPPPVHDTTLRHFTSATLRNSGNPLLRHVHPSGSGPRIPVPAYLARRP